MRSRSAAPLLALAFLAAIAAGCAGDAVTGENADAGGAGTAGAGAGAGGTAGAVSGGRGGDTGAGGAAGIGDGPGTGGDGAAGTGGGQAGAGGAAGVAGTGGGAGGGAGTVVGAGGAGAGGRGGTSGSSGGRGGAAGSSGGAAGSGRGGAAGGAGAGGRGGAVGGAGAGGRGGAAGSGNVTVYVAGDSTVQTYTGSTIHQAGWGQYLDDYFNTQVTVTNRAIGGRTSRRFIEEGRLTSILTAMRAGDYLFVQFGTNDSNQTAVYDDGEPYYLAPGTDFKTYMQMYIDGAKGRGGIPVLVTPPPRNSCRGDGVSFNYSFTSYATAMKELGQANSVAVVDLGARAVAYLNGKVDCDWASANFFLIRADGTVDGTHFQEMGANILAGLVVDGVRELALPLAGYIK